MLEVYACVAKSWSPVSRHHDDLAEIISCYHLYAFFLCWEATRLPIKEKLILINTTLGRLKNSFTLPLDIL